MAKAEKLSAQEQWERDERELARIQHTEADLLAVETAFSKNEIALLHAAVSFYLPDTEVEPQVHEGLLMLRAKLGLLYDGFAIAKAASEKKGQTIQ